MESDTKLGPEVLAELKAAEALATPGPWKVDPEDDGEGRVWITDRYTHGLAKVSHCDFDSGKANARLVALLRNHAPALIAAAERCGSLAIELQEVKRVDLEQMEWMSDRINELDRRNDEQDRHRRKALADVYTLTTDRDALAAKLAEVEGRKAMATAPCTHATTVHVFSVGEDAPGKSLDTISQCTVCGAVVHDYRHGGGMTSPNYPIVTESPLTVPFRQLAQQLIEAERDRDALARKVAAYSAMLRMGESCSLETVVRELVAMGRICKDAHDSDAHGWEVRENALKVGEAWLATLTPPAGVRE